jgi:hypothetical protein
VVEFLKSCGSKVAGCVCVCVCVLLLIRKAMSLRCCSCAGWLVDKCAADSETITLRMLFFCEWLGFSRVAKVAGCVCAVAHSKGNELAVLYVCGLVGW